MNLCLQSTDWCQSHDVKKLGFRIENQNKLFIATKCFKAYYKSTFQSKFSLCFPFAITCVGRV